MLVGAAWAMSRMISATAGALRTGAAPIDRRMPRRVALTVSELVGDSWPASLWAWRIAAPRRESVEGFKPDSASLARYAAAVSGVAGTEATPRLRQNAWKRAKSLR